MRRVLPRSSRARADSSAVDVVAGMHEFAHVGGRGMLEQFVRRRDLFDARRRA